ncbi:hypothetical protein HDU96_003671 [Phlyctochytrium bullatum]|nr:hypothetical protein HDU96_003671 [Phlyctochytrium bullatum]
MSTSAVDFGIQNQKTEPVPPNTGDNVPEAQADNGSHPFEQDVMVRKPSTSSQREGAVHPEESNPSPSDSSLPAPPQNVEASVVVPIDLRASQATHGTTPITVARKSNQFRALARKSLSYQQRQVFNNVCCISLCPLFMVVISAALGAFIMTLIQRTRPIEDVLYCGNNRSLNTDGWPRYRLYDPEQFGANTTNGKSTNYANVIAFSNYDTYPGAETLNYRHPCVFWWGSDYPQFSTIYEKNGNLTGLPKLDSTFTTPPNGGWASVFANVTNSTDQLMLQMFSQFQLQTWGLVSAATPELDAILGARPQQSLVGDRAELVRLGVRLANTTSAKPYVKTAGTDGAYGLLGAMETRYFYNVTAGITTVRNSTTNTTSRDASTSFQGLQPIPYFLPAAELENRSGRVLGDDLDDVLANRIRSLLTVLSEMNKTVLFKNRPTAAELTAFNLDAGKVTKFMPYGALVLEQFETKQKLGAKVVMQVGGDKRISASASYPSQGKRQMMFYTQLVQALLRAFAVEQDAGAGRLGPGFTITQGVRIFPEVKSTKLEIAFGGLIGRILYPFGVSFLLPIFVILLVKEKEDRILIMMKMNGMKSWAYYATHYITFYILFTASTIIFLVSGRLVRLEFFTLTQPSVLVILFFLWGHVQIALAFFFASIFNKSRIALVLTFLIVLCGVIISIVLERLFAEDPIPPALFLWPPFAFYRALSLVNKHSYAKNLPPYRMSMLRGRDEVYVAVLYMVLGFFIYGLLSLYFSAVLPSDFGVRRPWHFPVSAPIKEFYRRKRIRENGGVDPESEKVIGAAIELNEEELKYEDADVKAERQRIRDHAYPADSPIVVSDIRKVYAGRRGLGPKVAVKDVTFAAESGVIFGLLGPNGAGKTTLISILTGIYEASGGNARLAGFDIATHSQEVYKVIGVCPQFDILWDDLTVAEHLYFYARLKGVPIKEERAAVEKSMASVSLTTLQNRTAKGLSGGEKRRLSIAIALVGDPLVIFLDEPTTGLDPEVRRLIWNIIQDSREGKTVILTTHSMEEAEALCQRVGIMAKGTLRCIGNPLRLKELYGSGFRVFFNSKEEDTQRACAWVETLLPQGWVKVDSFATNTSYEFPPSPGIIPSLFQTIEEGKEKHGILDWGVSQTSLEEVFLKIITEDDANAD